MIDAPLAETAIVGACTGAAIMGMRPVAEMQFADFISCAWDHLVTVAAKQRYRAGRRCRSWSGCRRAAASRAARSTPEPRELVGAHPRPQVVCPATPEDAKGLLVTAIEDPNPVLFFEHKHLYRRIKAEVPEERYTTPFGKARIHREGDDISVITWGAMVYTAGEAANQLAKDDLSVEIIDLRTLMPWDRDAVLESARKTPRCSFSTRTRARAASAPRSSRRSPRRHSRRSMPRSSVCRPDAPVPFSPPLEKAFIPQVEGVIAGLKELAAY